MKGFRAIIYDHDEPVFCGTYEEEAQAYVVLEDLLKFMANMMGEGIWRKLSRYAKDFQSVTVGGNGFAVEAIQ